MELAKQLIQTNALVKTEDSNGALILQLVAIVIRFEKQQVSVLIVLITRRQIKLVKLVLNQNALITTRS